MDTEVEGHHVGLDIRLSKGFGQSNALTLAVLIMSLGHVANMVGDTIKHVVLEGRVCVYGFRLILFEPQVDEASDPAR